MMVIMLTFYGHNRRYLARYYSKVGWIITPCPYPPLPFHHFIFRRDLNLDLAPTNKTSSSCFIIMSAIIYVRFVVIHQPAIEISHNGIPVQIFVVEMMFVAAQIDLDGGDIVRLDLGKEMGGRRSGNGWLCDKGET